MDYALNEQLRQEWLDQIVEVDAERPELRRFAGSVGRVAAVNWNNQCLVDFADGAWYDIAPAFLRKVADEAARKKFDAKANSAQPIPARQS